MSIGRVCGTSASSAARQTTWSTSSSSANSVSSSQNARHRMFGSRPRTSTTSRSPTVAIPSRVVGQSIRRVTPSTSRTVGRLT